MTTDNRNRIPIPKSIKLGDVLILRDGQRKDWLFWNGETSICEGSQPSWHAKDGGGLIKSWDVVAIERQPKPALDDIDARYLTRLANALDKQGAKAEAKRLRAIARRLNGGKAVKP